MRMERIQLITAAAAMASLAALPPAQAEAQRSD
jgi:hypothetical protein